MPLQMPRLEALLLCEEIIRDEGGTHTLRMVQGRSTVYGGFPVEYEGAVYVKYAASPGVHAAELLLLQPETDEVVWRADLEGLDLRSSDVTGVTIVTVPIVT